MSDCRPIPCGGSGFARDGSCVCATVVMGPPRCARSAPSIAWLPPRRLCSQSGQQPSHGNRQKVVDDYEFWDYGSRVQACWPAWPSNWPGWIRELGPSWWTHWWRGSSPSARRWRAWSRPADGAGRYQELLEITRALRVTWWLWVGSSSVASNRKRDYGRICMGRCCACPDASTRYRSAADT